MEIKARNITFSNEKSFVLIGGINVIENYESALFAASHFKEVCSKLKINLVFKASYEKANRSSLKSYTGPGLKEGIKILARIKEELNIPIITDVHLPDEAHLHQKYVKSYNYQLFWRGKLH